jgi:hypothetical protein
VSDGWAREEQGAQIVLQVSRMLIAGMLISLCLIACGVLMTGGGSSAHADDTVASAVLSEENNGAPPVKRYEGSVNWTAEPASGPGVRAGDLVVRADVQIPDDGLAVTLAIRRNSDAAIAASHVVTLDFRPSTGFAGGAIGSVSGILLKAHLGARPLAGRIVKIDDRSFRVELSDDGAARTQNLQLLADSGWLTIAMIYSDGRHAELMLFKGATGQQAFGRAMATWN